MNSLMAWSLSVEVLVTPVVRMSMLIWPVFGSVAACYIACLISLIASSRSCFSTSLDSLILAMASDSLIMDSSYRGVAVIVLLVFPKDLMLQYSCTRSIVIDSVSFGLHVFLA